MSSLHGTGAKTKLRTRFVSFLACTMIVCVLGLSLVWEPRVTRVMSAAQVESLESNVEILSDALVPFLLQNQFGAIFETLESTQERNTNWKQVTITSMDGQRLYPLFDSPVVDGPDTIGTRKTISFEGKDLAVLTVGADISSELGQIRRQVRNLTILLSLFFLSSLVALGVLFENWVVRRVTLLATAARQLAMGNYSASIPEASNDELGVLTDSFRSMRITIRDNEEKLIASRDKAQRAADAKSRFLAMMSHEIRTPLNGVIPSAELLLEGELSEDQAQLVGTIHESGKSLKTIINDILDISKLDEGKLTIRKEEFSIDGVMRSVAGIFEGAARQKGLSLKVDIGPNLEGLVIGDEDRIRQVLANLVGNAVKFTSAGQITLRAESSHSDARKTEVIFEVEDTGIGIAKEDLGGIFERFSQVDNRSNREYQGSGLGLSICRQLVTAMGGDLAVESTLKKGSKFRFTLKFDPAAEKVSTSKSEPPNSTRGLRTGANSPSGTPNLPCSSNILVVDDNKTNLRIARAILASLKCSVTTVESGYEALDRLSEEEFDLILLDINMPGIDGYETARRIKSSPEKIAKTVILGHSASAFDEDIELCKAAGMNGFLPKPLSKKALVDQMQLYL